MLRFTDVFLYAFLVPILPYVLENRLGLDVSLTQRLSFSLLAESAIASLVCSPFIGHYADGLRSKKGLLLASLAVALFGTVVLALATSRMILCYLFPETMVPDVCRIHPLCRSSRPGNCKCVYLGRRLCHYRRQRAAGASGKDIWGNLASRSGWHIGWSYGGWDPLRGGRLLVGMVECFRDHPGGHRVTDAHAGTAETDPRCVLSLCNSVNGRADDGIGSPGAGHNGSDPENDPLLGEHRPMGEKTGWEFYAYIFRYRRFVAGVISYLTFAALISSFDTTLPLHVRDIFGWGSMLSGMMFFALQGPGIILSPLCGWLKDRVGTRWPTTVGFLALTPVMWLLGTPGDDRFPWANGGQTGQAIYTVCVTLVGALTCLLNGAGTIEATGMKPFMSFLLSFRRDSSLSSDRRRD